MEIKETLYIVMPAYNEAANIANVVDAWYPKLALANEDSRLVISDGGSKDDTVELLRELQSKYPKLEVIEKPGTDHGTKVIFLYKYAISKGATWVFQTDSDGQTMPSEFDQFWEERANYDVLLGNRIARGDGKKRQIVENVLRTYLFIYFGVMVKDANVPFRLMRAASLAKYIDLMPAVFNLPNGVLAACFKRFNERMKYNDITFRPRQGGKNSMNYKLIFKIGWHAFSDLYHIRKKMEEYEKTNS